MLGSPITAFQNISSSKVYFTSKLKGGQGDWVLVEGGEQGAQAGKGVISLSHIEIKDHPAMQTVSGPCQFRSPPPMRVTVGFFFVKAKERFSHAVAPLTSYKWSKMGMENVYILV